MSTIFFLNDSNQKNFTKIREKLKIKEELIFLCNHDY